MIFSRLENIELEKRTNLRVGSSDFISLNPLKTFFSSSNVSEVLMVELTIVIATATPVISTVTSVTAFVATDNKGITNISYNHLNLPTAITWTSTKKIEYLYNASGVKVQKKVTNGTSIHTTDYIDGFQYYNNVLKFFPTAEGYVKNTVLNGQNTYDYVYNYTDHLGNIRLSYAKDPATGELKILEENHYYPFGMKHKKYADLNKMIDALADESGKAVTGIDPNNDILSIFSNYDYKYNGKEFQDELGLGWYDYQARNYDPALGRWMNIDPLAEVSRRFSPYAYALNNPVYFIDPDGMMATPPDWYIDASTGKVLGQDGAATNDVRVIRGSEWRGTVSDFGGSTSAEATAYLQQNSSVITVNETQIQSDVNAINNATIADQSKERQALIGLSVDKSGNVPTAELTSVQGPVGTDGGATFVTNSTSDPISGDVTSKKFERTSLVPIAQIHTHNLVTTPGKENGLGTSADKDNPAAQSTGISVYAIDSWTGNTQGGNAIHRVTSDGTPSVGVGTTSNFNVGEDALKQHINMAQ